MARRIEIELTSARPDGTWTWRAAGAREPRGVLDGALLPAGAATGSVYKADAEVELDGITILSVSSAKEKSSKSGLLDFIESDKPFEGVTQQLARRERGERSDRPPRGDRRDRPPRGDGGERRPRRDGDRPPRRPGEGRGDGRPDRGAEGRPDRGGERHVGERPSGGQRHERGPRPERRPRPNFTAPPELPQRPKPKRLKPGRAHRNAVLADLPEEQRPVAERALAGGIPAVRQAVNEQNARLRSEGKPEVPAAGLLSMAEQLLPRLRVAEWLDRADAAKADLDELDLRDLRSVVAAGEDPMVARDESTRQMATELKAALATKQERELALWFEDIDAAIGVGRVIRALKMSSQPPKAGVRFPAELAARLANATTANLSSDAFPDRWVAVLEAAAFSPVRALVHPADKPTQISDELLNTVKRIAPLLPQVAALFEVPVVEGAPAPKPLRPTRPAPPKKAAAKPATPRPPKQERHEEPAPAPAPQEAEPAAVEAGAQTDEVPVHEPAVDETPVDEPAVDETPVDETPVDEPAVDETPVDEAPAEAAPADDTAVEDTPES